MIKVERLTKNEMYALCVFNRFIGDTTKIEVKDKACCCDEFIHVLKEERNGPEQT